MRIDKLSDIGIGRSPTVLHKKHLCGGRFSCRSIEGAWPAGIMTTAPRRSPRWCHTGIRSSQYRLKPLAVDETVDELNDLRRYGAVQFDAKLDVVAKATCCEIRRTDKRALAVGHDSLRVKQAPSLNWFDAA